MSQDLVVQSSVSAPHWYVARTQSHHEKLARASLLSEGLDAYLPMTFKTNRKQELYALPLFPGFLFVRLQLGATGWTRVFSARGIAAVLSCGGRPSAVSDRMVAWLRAVELDHFREHALEAPSCAAFKPGETVLVRKGAWAEFAGVFVERVDARRSVVLMELLGAWRDTVVETEHLEASEEVSEAVRAQSVSRGALKELAQRRLRTGPNQS